MIELTRDGNVAILQMRAGKANALTIRLLRALMNGVDDAAGADALVITGETTFFSGGLALPELIDLDRTGMGEALDLLEDMLARVLTWPRATIAAINGHAVAGGCVLALMCDVRLMADANAKIGLNEVQLGLGLPAIVTEVLRARVSAASFATIALEGHLFMPHEALELGLVDDVTASLDAKALSTAGVRGASPKAYAQIKAAQLAPVVAAWRARRPIDRETWLDTWFSDAAQRALRAAVDRMTKR